jgi:hypothetical protein
VKSKYLVVDDFCDVPDQVVQEVYAAGIGTWTPEKGEIGSSIYEGMGFWGPHAVLLAPLIDAVRHVIVPNSMFFRVTNVGMEKAYIHSDRESGAYTAIVYLSEHKESSGTAFYKHKPTGLIEMPSFEDMRAMGRAGKELHTDMVTRDPDKWEQLDYVEGKYNRALIFDAPLFHSRFPVDGIGDTEETGRLIWASHFYKLDGSGLLF